ncbi:MAG: hypothetical protein IJS00_05290 [Paludibacteraceae bacterium]|nr:hypothetical protein [Paludibacteraceae bacterium]
MKRYIIIVFCALGMSLSAQVRHIDDINYQRSSIYSLLINHTEQDYGTNIADIFLDIPLPDKYNNHDLSVKIITINKRTPLNERGKDFLERNDVASHLVARWFNRDPFTGECNMDLVSERALYSASEFSRQIAQHSLRGNALLEDADSNVIKNTFVIVNDIRYIDKEKAGRIAGLIFQGLLMVAGGVASGMSGTNMSSSFNDLGDSMNQLMQTLKGFKVKVRTHLYQLQWDEAIATEFYETMYSAEPNEEKVKLFDKNRKKFRLQYIGSQLSSGSDVSFIGVNLSSPDEMIRKACTRAIDENVANLAKNFEVFKVKVPISNASPIQAPIGKKEEISENSRFEVLEAHENDGKINYHRVAVIRPIKGQIWDNRYMSVEEGATGSTLNYTTFQKVSGGEIARGMLIREISKK